MLRHVHVFVQLKDGVLDILIYLFENYFDTDADDGPEPDRDTQLDSLVETVGNQPDHRAELDHRVRPDQTLGFRQR